MYDYECSQYHASLHVYAYFTWHVAIKIIIWLIDWLIDKVGNGSHNSNLANTTMLLLLDSFKQHAVDSVFCLADVGSRCRQQMSRLSPKEVVHKIIRFDNCGIAHLVERPTEKPGAILTRVRVPCVARDFSSKASFQSQLLTVSEFLTSWFQHYIVSWKRGRRMCKWRDMKRPQCLN